MAGNDLQAAVQRLPEALHEPVLLWAERLLEQDADAFRRDPVNLHRLLRFAACSEFASGSLLRHWGWFSGHVIGAGTTGQNSPDDVSQQGTAALPDDDSLQRVLRQERNRGLLSILWHDLNGSASLGQTLSALSALADNLIRKAAACAGAGMRSRFGVPRDDGGEELGIVVLAMGKLGGRELNFSSDIDLIFLYPADGESDGKRRLPAQEYFTRVARRIVALLDEVTPEGFAYRVDTRLRPFGDSGPPVVSFGALESYLLRHGRGWERYAWVKARVVEPQTGPVADDLMANIVEPFVYRRYLDYGVFESLRDMKALVAAESRKRRLATDIKLGRGGIREVEFIVQSLQLVRGGSDRKLRTTELQTALQHLGRTRSLRSGDAADLGKSYCFLRRLENFMQAIRDQQTHVLPDATADRVRLALAMGHADWSSLLAETDRHRQTVSRLFEAVAFRGGESALQADVSGPVAALWNASAGHDEWSATLEELGYAEADEMAQAIVAFAGGTPVGQVDSTGGKRLARFMPALLAALAGVRHPSVVLGRVLGIVEQILRRSAYLALLNENPVVLERLVGLCDASAWLAEEVGRYPLLLDELLDPRLYSEAPTQEEMHADLVRRLDGVADAESEQQVEMLGQFQRATLFRIAVADVMGNLPVMKVSDRLTELAEIVVNSALDIAWSDLTVKHGQPYVETSHGRRRAGFGVIAYGKFGGMELSYRSDLDLVFLHDSSGDGQVTDGARPLDNTVFFARLVRRLVHFLTAQTPSGALYDVDTRLRPSGRSGLLVTSVEAFARYQEENAWTWEHQALLRSRPVAGSAPVAREFERIRAETLRARVRRDRLERDVRDMRARMHRQLDKSDREHFDLKQGDGGIGDIEFLVQYLVLKNADRHPAVIHYPDNIRQLGVLAAAGSLEESQVVRLQDIYKAYRLCLHRLVLDEQPPLVANERFVEERRWVMELRERLLGPP